MNQEDRIRKKLTDGIIYLFQYGYISEAKHFRMLEELETGRSLSNQSGSKF